MATLTLKTPAGDDKGDVELADNIFGIEPNVPVMHQVVTAQLAARRSGTQSTKTRAEKRGGGAKPWRQKGTGRARQGSIRSPQWRGGGVALGPKPRSYEQRTPKKMVKLALRSALSDRAADGKVIVVESWDFATPKTKDAVAALAALGVEGRALVVVKPDDRETWLSFRNLPEVHVLSPGELNAYDVLVADVVIFSQETLPTGEGIADNRRTKEQKANAREAAKLVRQAKSAQKPKAVKPAKGKPAGDDSDEPVSLSEEAYEGEDDDMASDLPNRPKNENADGEKTIIEATDRVKSKTEKEDPRFAAARQKADREDRLLAARDKKAAKEASGEEITEEDEPVLEKPKKKQTFSFGNTEPEE